MRKQHLIVRITRLAPVMTLCVSACTQLPNNFRLQQQEEVFSSSQSFNSKLDMLWVIDNSPSMGPAQKKIRDGFQRFADRYMQPSWDIRVAVISQDTYLAHPDFAGYLNSTDPNGIGWHAAASGTQVDYLSPTSTANPRRATPFVSPSWWGTTSITSTGKVNGPLKVRHGAPGYGGANLSADVGPSNPSQWARLVPGRHDGPMQAICWPLRSAPFFFGVSDCSVRDHEDLYSGVGNCVQGGTGNLDSDKQCVNTIMNNTVRSGRPIISTRPPAGVAADDAWKQQLYSDFMVNLSGGTSGLGVEKFFNSVEQLITDNESSSTAFFRPGALRVVIFVSDEDDQSMVFPASTQIIPTWGYDGNTSCPWKTVDGHTYRLQICPQASKLLGVSQFKSELDAFFQGVDQSGPGGNPNYFVVSIGPQSGATLQQLHDDFGESGGGYSSVSSDYPQRVSDLVDLVQNRSLKLELTSTDYSPLLDQIGLSIVQNKATFQLSRAATGQEDMFVKILKADGSVVPVSPSQYTIAGTLLTFVDLDFVLALGSDDRISVSYQPRSL
jgi:hypothetical protein